MDEKKTKREKIIIEVVRYTAVVLVTVILTLFISGASFEQIYLRYLIHRYYDGELNKEQVNENAIAGMIYGLDEYSSYVPSEIGYESFNESTTGEYGGVGVEVLKTDEGFCVTKVFEGSPAEAAGVQVQDYITAIDGESTVDWKSETLTEHMRGEIGSNVQVELRRGSETLSVTVQRAQINAPTVDMEILENHIGYVKVSQFDMDTDKELEKAIDRMEGINSLIIDLRGNPGGIMQTCLRALDLFFEKDTTLSIARYKKKEWIYKAESDAKYTMPIVVLTDKDSASASEIFSACMKDHQRATIVGTNTYGKGSIQRTFNLPNNAAANITIGHFYSPNEQKIDKTGVKPDREVKETDAQLEAAIAVLKK